MNIGNRKLWTGSLLTVSLCAAATAYAAAPNGFWAAVGNADADNYPTYLKIEGGKGFYCILDDKSSFAFNVAGDSITTPMNGKDRIDFFPASGDVVIAGEEKGEPYSTRFDRIEAMDFPEGCVEREEAASGGTGISRRAERNPRAPHGLRATGTRDVLGRHPGPRRAR